MEARDKGVMKSDSIYVKYNIKQSSFMVAGFGTVIALGVYSYKKSKSFCCI